MSELVDPRTIEDLVGVKRHATAHFGHAVEGERVFYILHSQECVDSGVDLRECQFSVALDEGIDDDVWIGSTDKPVLLTIWLGQLVPASGGESRKAKYCWRVTATFEDHTSSTRHFFSRKSAFTQRDRLLNGANEPGSFLDEDYVRYPALWVTIERSDPITFTTEPPTHHEHSHSTFVEGCFRCELSRDVRNYYEVSS